MSYLAGEFGEGGGDGVGALGEGVHLEHTHRTVPDHGLRDVTAQEWGCRK